MPRERHRRAQPAAAETGWLLLAALLMLAVLVVGAVWGWGQVGPLGRAGIVVGALLLAVTAAAATVAVLRRRKSSTDIDYKARYLTSGPQMKSLMSDAAAKSAAKLRASAAGPGVPLGTHLPSNRRVYSTWEWVQVWLMGPRSGKTTCVCVPQLLETSGPALFTTNKLDGIPETRGPRSRIGQVWVHDVQNVVGEEPSWWWNPLSGVTSISTARALADVFITAETSAGAKQDAYFTSAAKATLARLLLAAAVDGRPVTDVFDWAQDPDDKQNVDGSGKKRGPARILQENGFPAEGRALAATQALTEKQRDGVYGTLQEWIGILGDPEILPWITDPTGRRPHFDHHAFVRSTDTLYLVSKEGEGSARAITAALTAAVLSAAEKTAAEQGGRLSPPLTAVLDEVANVCRWRQLPDVYSHYGSRGIVLSSFFQSWAQGVEAFGEHAMAKLFSAANVSVVGAGLKEAGFLRQASELIDDADQVRRSRSTGSKGGPSTSTSISRERLFSVGDLAALPTGRAVALVSGKRPSLLRLDHYTARPYAEDVLASKTYYENEIRKQADTAHPPAAAADLAATPLMEAS
ncbi:type IV secretory system conjugative DNA transfer family protein [Isoptericola sp. NPDC055881]